MKRKQLFITSTISKAYKTIREWKRKIVIILTSLRNPIVLRAGLIILAVVVFWLLVINTGGTGYPLFSGLSQVFVTAQMDETKLLKFPFVAQVRITPPSVDTKTFQVSINYLNYYRPIDSPIPEVDELCIDSIVYVEDPTNKFGGGNRRVFGSFEENCINLSSPSGWSENPGQKRLVNYSFPSPRSVIGIPGELGDHNGYLYPYDRLENEFTILIPISAKKGGQEIGNFIISPQVMGRIDGGIDWDVSLEANTDIQLDKRLSGSGQGVDLSDFEGPYNALKVKLVRPLLYQVVYPVVFIGIFSLIIALFFVRSLDTFLQCSTAILFGILGIREILRPPGINIRTILDIILLGLYFLFAIALIQDLLLLLIEKRGHQEKGESTSKQV